MAPRLKSILRFGNLSCGPILIVVVSLFVCSVDVVCVTRTGWFYRQDKGNVEASDAHKVLELGKPIECELAGEQKHQYQITLAEAQYAYLVVEQRGIDVLVRVLGANGEPVFDFDSEIRSQGLEPVEFVAESAGNYRVVVEGKGLRRATGRYEVRLTEIRAATERDRLLQEARTLLRESTALFSAGKYDQALPPATKALEIRQKVLEPGHADIAASLSHLGEIHRRRGDYAKTEALHLHALEIRERALGPEHPAFAASLNFLAETARARGDYAKAKSLHEQALAIREKVFGAQHAEVAESLRNLGVLYYLEGNYTKAESFCLRSLEICEHVVGPNSISTAHALNGLGLVYSDLGDYAKAIAVLERGLDIFAKALGDEHPNVATSLLNLARIYRYKGDFDKAERLYQRAHDVYLKTKPEHPDMAILLNNLAMVHRDRGDYDKAEQLYLRALEIYQKALGAEHSLVASSLNNLANLYGIKGEFRKSEELHQRALAMREKTLPPGHPEIATSIHNLAGARRRNGDLAGAELLDKQALEMFEKTLGPAHLLVSDALSGIALVYKERGDYNSAEPLYRRALNIRENALGPENPNVAEVLNDLAVLYAAKGDLPNAVAAQSRANAITERNLALNLVSGSERQKLAYLESLSGITDQTLSLHLHVAPENPAARQLAVAAILQRKGRVLDAMSDSRVALRQRLSAEDQVLLDRLNDTTAQLARLVLNGPQRISLDEHQKRIGVLEEQREKFESEISFRSAGFYQPSAPVTLATIQAAIPPNAALIEFSTYRPFDPKATDSKAYGDPRYVAYVVRGQGQVQWREIGDAREIDGAVDRLRQALGDPKRNDVKRLARIFDEKVMRPIRALAGEATHLLVSPDGELNLIPFAALVDERGHYLVESYDITYVTSGRDLLRMQVARTSQGPPVVVADPAFGAPAVIAAREEADRATPAAGGRARFDYSQIFFGPLPGVNDEVRALRELLPNAQFLTRERATKTALQGVSAPSILHIATHGFFLQVSSGGKEESGAAASSNDATRMIKWSTHAANPLLRSGLALAGANQSGVAKDNGILTALEASGLNLWGTKLVVLSACNTGLGEVRNGDGVYGLRRAFVLAGAESQLMSLWPVSDRSTRDLMVGYYNGLVQGQGRGEALRLVQLKMMRGKARVHPYYWASFIQTGEWANLEGRR